MGAAHAGEHLVVDGLDPEADAVHAVVAQDLQPIHPQGAHEVEDQRPVVLQVVAPGHPHHVGRRLLPASRIGQHVEVQLGRLVPGHGGGDAVHQPPGHTNKPAVLPAHDADLHVHPVLEPPLAAQHIDQEVLGSAQALEADDLAPEVAGLAMPILSLRLPGSGFPGSAGCDPLVAGAAVSFPGQPVRARTRTRDRRQHTPLFFKDPPFAGPPPVTQQLPCPLARQASTSSSRSCIDRRSSPRKRCDSARRRPADDTPTRRPRQLAKAVIPVSRGFVARDDSDAPISADARTTDDARVKDLGADAALPDAPRCPTRRRRISPWPTPPCRTWRPPAPTGSRTATRPTSTAAAAPAWPARRATLRTGGVRTQFSCCG